jgi:ATP-dependent Zn protease
LLQTIPPGCVVLYKALTINALTRIAENSIAEHLTHFNQQWQTHITWQDTDKEALLLALILSFGPDFSTRGIQDQISHHLLDSISDYFLAIRHVGKIQIGINSDLKSHLDRWLLERDTLTSHFFRMNQQLQLHYRFSEDGTEMTMSGETRTASPADDYSGAVGLMVEVPQQGFEAIHGHKRVKERLQEVIDLLKDNSRHSLLSKGMLLYGKPGTGKTMLARALAKEAGMPFIATTAQELIGNPELIGAMFEKARRYAPAIVFIDEFELFGHRGKGNLGIDSLVNRMLTEIDGFSSKDGATIFIIAATNLPNDIDAALVRSGRIDLHYEVPLLDKEARHYFIQQLLARNNLVPFNLSKDDVDYVVNLTAGMSGADLAMLEREVQLLALRQKQTIINKAVLVEAIAIKKYGERSEAYPPLDKKILERTALHEAAHAAVFHQLNPTQRIEELTIVPRGDSLGFTVTEGYAGNQSWPRIKNQVMVALAGRMVEIQLYGEDGIDSGARSDLKQANTLLAQAICNYGMAMDSLPNLNLDSWPDSLKLNLSSQLETLIQQHLQQLTQETATLIEQLMPKIEQLAQALLDQETMTHDTITNILLDTH